jgi:hypothetical protein
MTIRIQIICSKCSRETALLIKEGVQGPSVCPRCQSFLFAVQPIAGSVYVLSNASMPGLLKIGFTTREVEDRATEISSATGVPEPFFCEAHWLSSRPDVDERNIHNLFAKERRSDGREFFQLSVEAAVKRISNFMNAPPEGENLNHLEKARVEGPEQGHCPIPPGLSVPKPVALYQTGFGSDRYREYENERNKLR